MADMSGTGSPERQSSASGPENRRLRSLPRPKRWLADNVPEGKARCSRCEEIKPAEAFYKGRLKNGLHAWCKECCKESSRSFAQKYRQEAQELSQEWDPDTTTCQAVVTVGRWTRYFAHRCSRRATVGGYCLSHARPEDRERSRTLRKIIDGAAPFGSEAYRERIAAERRMLLEAFQCDPEAASLLEEHTRDLRSYRAGSPWRLSLDSFFLNDTPWYDLVGYGSRWLKSYTTDAWTDVVIAKVDRAREIDAWAEERAA